jgi:hypothetical protein
MEAASRTPDAIVVGGDDEDQIQVQPVTEGGTRSVEIHLWRHGPADAPPARDVLDLDLPDLDSLRQGIAELLEASEGGTRVARIVLDTAEGRRLRLETEPFGTRYVARVVFWQRTRVTWRPDGDPIVVDAGLLRELHDALLGLRPWLDEPPDRQMTAAIPIVPEPWPNPGADWLTVDRSSVAFHPRGVRITCSVEEHGDDHCLEIRQWRREDSLWVPERISLRLSTSDLDALLSVLHDLSSREEPVSREAGGTLRASITGDPPDLVIDRRVDDGFERCLAFPLVYLPHFGRALSQSWTLLVGWLSDTEREHLREDRRTEMERTVETPSISDQEAPPAPAAPQPLGPVFRFGRGSDTPGTVIPQEGRVRVVLEGFLMPRGLTLPAPVLWQVITGLEELFERQKTESRVPPLLMCERPDCAVYGRVGTNIRPEAVELRVWTSPRDSDAVTFDKVYLPDVINALRESARLLGQPEPLPVPPAAAPEHREIEGNSDLDTTAAIPAVPSEPEPEPVHVGDLSVGSSAVSLDLTGHEDRRSLTLSWDEGALRLPLSEIETLLADIRDLYYDSLRGMRGRALAIEDPPLDITLLSRGQQLQIEIRGPESTLAFPASEVPTFLNATREALDVKE